MSDDDIIITTFSKLGGGRSIGPYKSKSKSKAKSKAKGRAKTKNGEGEKRASKTKKKKKDSYLAVERRLTSFTSVKRFTPVHMLTGLPNPMWDNGSVIYSTGFLTCVPVLRESPVGGVTVQRWLLDRHYKTETGARKRLEKLQSIAAAKRKEAVAEEAKLFWTFGPDMAFFGAAEEVIECSDTLGNRKAGRPAERWVKVRHMHWTKEPQGAAVDWPYLWAEDHSFYEKDALTVTETRLSMNTTVTETNKHMADNVVGPRSRSLSKTEQPPVRKKRRRGGGTRTSRKS